jgi:RNA polymerase sigma factor (sigma-70 family)
MMPRMQAQSHGLGRRALASRREPALRSRAARGDQAAFSALYERHHQALYRYCRSILQHDQDAQDALHNTMLSAFAALQEEQRDFELRPWLFRIAHNEAISIVRRRRETGEPVPDVEDPRSLEDEVAGREDLRVLREDLRQLTDKQRSALVLRELSGLSPAEIGAVIGASPGTAKQTVLEARLALHECREGRAMACEEVCRSLSDGDGRVLRGRRIRAHLRACSGCRGFQEDLRRRPQALAALSPPLPAAAGLALLHSLLPAAGKAASGGAWWGSGGGVLGAAGAKVAVGAAVVAAAGATEVAVHATRPPARPAPQSAPARPNAARPPAAAAGPAPAASPGRGAAPDPAATHRRPAAGSPATAPAATAPQPTPTAVHGAHAPASPAGGSAGAKPSGGKAHGPSSAGQAHGRSPGAGSRRPSTAGGGRPAPSTRRKPATAHPNGSAHVPAGQSGALRPSHTGSNPQATPGHAKKDPQSASSTTTAAPPAAKPDVPTPTPSQGGQDAQDAPAAGARGPVGAPARGK